MAYNNAIPGPNDLLSQSQSDIQQNFAEIQTLIGVNHLNFGVAGEGKHLYLQMPEHAAPATAIDEAGFYANVGATSTVTELFFRRENNGASIPMTETVETTVTNGWSYLPSGLIIQWGQQVINNDTLFTFPKAMTKTYSIQLSSLQASPSIVAYRIESQIAGISFNASALAVGGSHGAQATSTSILVIGI